MENITLRLTYDGKLLWADGIDMGLYGSRTVSPRITAELRRMARVSEFQKITVEVSEMYPGEVISITGVFFVPEENALKVRVDDWIESGMWRTFKPDQENAPHVLVWYSPKDLKINSGGMISLEKYTNKSFSLVVRYEEYWPNIGTGGGLVDGTITRG
ncbi:MAG: hypothetical protein QXG10_05130 [Candidatus Hadarchaeales archaeon]